MAKTDIAGDWVSLFNGKDLSGWHTDIPKADKFRKLDLTPLK